VCHASFKSSESRTSSRRSAIDMMSFEACATLAAAEEPAEEESPPSGARSGGMCEA